MSIDSDPTGREQIEGPAVRGRAHDDDEGRVRRGRTTTRNGPRRGRDDGYAHERVAGRSSVRPARVGVVLVAAGGVGALVVVVAAALLGSVGSLGSAIGDGIPLFAGGDATAIDPAPLVAVVRLVRDASLVVSGITTGVGGCLLAIAAVRVRGRR